MTVVELKIDQTWLTSLNDDTVSLQVAVPQREESDGIGGQVVSYGPRSVAEVDSTRKRSTPLTIYLLNGADGIGQLREWWLGAEPLLLRDNLGWWRSGVILSANLKDLRHTVIRGERVLQVDVTFQDIDWNFAV